MLKHRYDTFVQDSVDFYVGNGVCSSIGSLGREIHVTKETLTHRFHKAQVYCLDFYSDPVW